MLPCLRDGRRHTRDSAMSVVRYGGPFLIALSIPVFWYLVAPAASILSVVMLLLLLIGAEAVSRRGAVPTAPPEPRIFRFLPILYVPLQLALIVWGVAMVGHADVWSFIALALSIGVTTGVFGVLAAHELVHGHNRIEHAFGLAMLSGMTYRHFRVAHIFGHHRWAATENDAATARLGEGFYAFLIRTVTFQFVDAWRFEQRRTRDMGPLANRVTRDVAAMALIYAVLFLLAGWRGALFFACQSAAGIIVLELFNYIAHYGLTRRTIGGRREPFSDRHSWNSSNVMANLLIFNMGRHSFHHTRPTASYQTLRHVETAPELPAGYAGSILLALAPPLWRAIMDPAVQRLHNLPDEAAV
jgi:alkane 1-monooxygenase